jgi:branched-subunit amino acid transport protein
MSTSLRFVLVFILTANVIVEIAMGMRSGFRWYFDAAILLSAVAATVLLWLRLDTRQPQ